MADWMPIESAPKDEDWNTPVLVAGSYGGESCAAVAEWWNAGWRFMEGDGPIMSLCFVPTHWMPLPPPPDPT